ncbi:MAG: hypothetical protein MR449_02695 [Spirochaetia bacterium]|nr:hypothetical protein [Spirochaetia bacterium]
MEKSTEKKPVFIFRLLVLFLLTFCSSEIFAKRASYEYVRSLKFLKGQEYFFTLSDCTFYLDIKNVLPENVTVYVNSLPENVSFVSSKKEVLLPEPDSDDDIGTHIVMHLNFAKPGTYKIKSIDVIVNGIFYRLPFETVQVYENPRNLMPELSVEFDDETQVKKNKASVLAGENVEFTVYAKYAVQITNISWTLPKDSLFKETLRYDFAESSNLKSDFSDQKIPVISFSWQPLVSGKFSFPEIKIIALAYNGSHMEIKTPDYEFSVGKNEIKKEDESAAGKNFENSFRENFPVENKSENTAMSFEELYNLVSLRNKERHSFPFFNKYRKERILVEEKFALENYENETSVVAVIILAVMSILLFAVSVFMIVTKKTYGTFICSFAFLLVFTATVICGIKCSEKHGIFKGGVIRPIPEKNVSSAAELKSGSLVCVQSEAGKWLYVKHNETYGWILKDDMYEIK